MRPSLLKSPNCASTHVFDGSQLPIVSVSPVVPCEKLADQSPDVELRARISLLLSPLRSKTFTSTKVTVALHVSHLLRTKLPPVLRASHHSPLAWSRAMTSSRPSPSKSAAK